MRKGITKRQREVLDVINKYVEEKGYSPSYQEIAMRMNISSAATIHGFLNILRLKGLVTWEPKMPRTLKVIKEKTASS